MRLRQIEVYADEALVEKYPGGFVQRFHRESLCVTTAWMLALGKQLESNTVSKLLIVACEARAMRPANGALPLNLWLSFDFVHYHQAMNSTKRQLLGELVRTALETIAPIAGWELNTLSTAYAQASANNFLVQQRMTKSWVSPSRRHRAIVEVKWDIDGVNFNVIIADRQGRDYVERAAQLLGVVPPYEGCVAAYASGARWLDDHTFCLEAKDYPTGRLTLRV